MVRKAKKLIKVPLVIPGVAMMLFVVIIFYLETTRDTVNVAGYETKIDSIYIDYNLGRGGFEYKDNYVISTDAVLIKNPCGSSVWQTHGPIIDFDSEPHEYSFGDLETPFLMFKNEKSDTINIIKEGCKMSFLLLREYD